MKTYALYLESGPRRQRTMVHVPQLLGCMANGPTTEAALEATPAAISSYLRFLQGTGEPVQPDEEFAIEVAEHVAEAGKWLGNGSPYVTFASDLEPVSAEELELLCRRFLTLRETLAAWCERQRDEYLDAQPAGGGRTARRVLLHLLPGPAAYLSPVLGAVSGVSRLMTLAERGDLNLPQALRQVGTLAAERLRATTAEERSRLLRRPNEVRTLRKGLRRMLEHDWEHLVELARRPGGPTLQAAQ